MSKRRKSSGRRPQQRTRKKQSQPRQSLLQRLAGQRKRILLIVAVIAFAVAAYYQIDRLGKPSVEERLASARHNLMLGRVQDAIVDYHRVLNELPDNEQLQYEQYLAQTRAGAVSSPGADQVVAAAQRVKNRGSYPLLGSVLLAQMYQQTAESDAAAAEALPALEQAAALNDSAAQVALYEVLAMHYREAANFDSSLLVSKAAIGIATALDDSFHVAVSQLTAGIAALHIDSLEFAGEVFHRLIGYTGISSGEIVPVATVALADRYEKSGQSDSALFYLRRVETRLRPNARDAVAAYGFTVMGNTKCAQGEHDAGTEFLERGIEVYRLLGNVYEGMLAMNSIAACYRDARDWYNARKYYMAAGNLAKEYGHSELNLYSADLNVRFLKELSQSDYKRSGEEGLELAAQFSRRE